ncbi:MAG: hypothetical protein JWL59_1978 [Chthoniobacteraceae bacterium]|nr:hypothetical protein [Chthoniobacteraceae bacterium]
MINTEHFDLRLPRGLALHLLACTSLFCGASALAQSNNYEQTILVANRAEYRPVAFVDQYLVNPWGIALRPPGAGGHIWVSNAKTATTSLYIGDAHGVPLHQDGLKVLRVDGPLVSYEDGVSNVTGQVYNAASDLPGQLIEFPVTGPATNFSGPVPTPLKPSSGAAKFVFVTTDGTINAWRANTAESMESAVIVKDFSEKGADRSHSLPFLPAYTGVAMTTSAFTKKDTGGNRLYVTDFQNNRIQVFDNNWKEITAQVQFQRPAGMAENLSPYNIQCIGDKLFVVFAVVDTIAEEPATDVPDEGAGHVVVYNHDGQILQELHDSGVLNSPWGIAIAPPDFGAMSSKLLIANFGDGTIAAFEPATGDFVDFLRDHCGNPISIEGIWGLAFGNGVSLGDANSLYFTAGPEGEQDGIFGRLNAGE